jgi:hypothetical protein
VTTIHDGAGPAGNSLPSDDVLAELGQRVAARQAAVDFSQQRLSSGQIRLKCAEINFEVWHRRFLSCLIDFGESALEP